MSSISTTGPTSITARKPDSLARKPQLDDAFTKLSRPPRLIQPTAAVRERRV
jgi:hypothetical protein